MNREQDNQNEQECTLDEVLMELDQILNDMEEENSLEETFKKYHKGIDLLKTCNDKICLLYTSGGVFDLWNQ